MITQSPSSARPVSALREIAEEGENTCWEPSSCLSWEAKDESPPDPGAKGHPLQGVTALFGPLAANPQ